MKIVNLEQNTPAWHKWRVQHVTATDAPKILDKDRWCGIHDHWMKKMGFVEPDPVNEAMERGQLLEPIARELLCKQLEINFEPAVIESDEYPWMGASLDGITKDWNYICEIKCMKLQKHLQVSKETIDPCHYAQMQHQLACTRALAVYYASYHPDAPEPLTIVKIFPDDKYIANMIEKEKEFFFETMRSMEPTRESWTFKEKVR
jgi:putative phage-type endonuclease